MAARKRDRRKKDAAGAAERGEPPVQPVRRETARRASRRVEIAVAAAVVLATLATYAPLLTCEFTTWDDAHWLRENRDLIRPTAANIGAYWRNVFSGLYVPVSFTVWGGVARLSHAFHAQRGGALDPRFFHGANLLFHALAVLAALAILRHVFGDPWAASAGALVFALHPVQVESVGWACGLKDVLCGLFMLVAGWQFLRVYRLLAAPDGAARGRPLAFGAACLAGTAAYGLALLSKPSAVVTPLFALALLVFSLCRTGDSGLRGLVRRLGAGPRRWALVLAAGWLLLAVPVVLYGRKAQYVAPLVKPPLWARPLIAGDAFSFYLFKLVWPARLAFDYGRLPSFVLKQAWLPLTGLLPYVLAGLLLLTPRRTGWLLAAMAVFAAALLPVLGFLSFQFQQYSTTADHYLYAAMLGPALAAAWLVARYGRPALAAAPALLLILGVRSFGQTRTWRDSMSLYSHALGVNPRSWVSCNNLGLLYSAQGRRAAAIESHRRAVELKPDYFDAHTNLGALYREQGRVEEALDHFRKALAVNGNDPEARTNLGLVYADQGRLQDALREYDKAIAAEPDHVEAHNNRGVALYTLGRIHEAIEAYRFAIARCPLPTPRLAQLHKNLGLAYYQQARYADALREWEQALAIAPQDPSIRNCVKAGREKLAHRRPH
ncbi:MAG: tetratricopeptide repeat protein [Kiritimatiellae bacterium]|nr:tetratricopeptide repeat protein [Kiritimatiellia bacterium]